MANTKNTYTTNLAYALLYALIVTVLVILYDSKSESFPILLKTENTLYDPIQKLLAIDHKEGWRIERFQSTLDQLYCIQLDSNYIDMESNRVKRDSLAALLQELAKINKDATLFLDYDFEPLDTMGDSLLLGKDSLLYESMLALGKRLIIVSDRKGKSVFSENTWTTRKYFQQRIPIAPINGGIELEAFVDEKKIRYFNLELEKTKDPSFVEILFELSTGKAFPQLADDIEINYLIRNNRPIGRRPILKEIRASSIVNQQRNIEHFNKKKPKLIFIGAFHKLVNKYDQTFDYFDTPIDSLNGIYVNLNAYLNVATNSFIQRSPPWLVFIVNFLLALGGSIYYQLVQQKKQINYIKPASWMRLELLFSFLFFVILIFGLFYAYYLKFPFVWTLLFFVMNQSAYQFFLSHFKKQ